MKKYQILLLALLLILVTSAVALSEPNYCLRCGSYDIYKYFTGRTYGTSYESCIHGTPGVVTPNIYDKVSYHCDNYEIRCRDCFFVYKYYIKVIDSIVCFGANPL